MNIQERAAAIASNPHNIGAGRLSNFDYWAAQFEREGRQARLGADCPYAPGTMAATRWQAGQAFQWGARQFGQGFPCPGDESAAQGWRAERSYYLEAIDRGGRKSGIAGHN